MVYRAATSDKVSEREQKNEVRARAVASQCTVLLENDHTLPLKQPGKLALFGNGARATVKGGTGSGDVNSRRSVNIEQGLREAGFVIMTEAWLDRQELFLKKAKDAYQAKLKKLEQETGIPAPLHEFKYAFEEPGVVEVTEEDIETSAANTAIYVLSRDSGEGRDRRKEPGDYELLDSELAALKKIADSYQKVIVVLNVGGIIDVGAVRRISGINSILLMGQLGNIGGEALADVITGQETPSGKLTDTWAKDYMDYPSSQNFSHNNGDVNDEYYTEGIFVGYRYFDTFKIEPEYCFGYGRSYTDFSITTTGITYREDQVEAEICVKNIGTCYSGKEVVQVYVSAPVGNICKPYQELCGFAKTKKLVPGEEQTVKVTFTVTSLASYSENQAAWVLEAGDYIIRVGNSSRNTKAEAVLRLDKTVITEQLTNRLRPEEPIEEIVPKRQPQPQEQIETVLLVAADGLPTKQMTGSSATQEPYVTTAIKQITVQDVLDGTHTAEELVAQLTPEEMAHLCVGRICIDEKGQSVLGAASTTVPGGAGETYEGLLETHGIRNIVLADGPAGLRLEPHFAVDADGNYLGGWGNMVSVPPTLPEDGSYREYYQYCTAIPIATSLAQTWDMELIEDIGKIVGEEMKEFGVTLWLAPGMNIHRNPLCGRNFEYYSEDPLLAGCCAAADTRGVQSYPGVGTTIKHFAANNQEDNRLFANMHVSERALREIYLKGFQIAIQTSQPMALMTSYNLLNGTHTANLWELITGIARKEWGFEGLVMSDWMTTCRMGEVFRVSEKYGKASAAHCIYAGNDLIMPGTKEDIEEILDSYYGRNEEKGVVTLRNLQECALHVLRTVIRAAVD